LAQKDTRANTEGPKTPGACPDPALVDNPTQSCSIGQAGKDGVPPVTLRLAIPPEFGRTTFQEEFYGRRFAISDGKLVTGIPWPPGRRELKYTYVAPTETPAYRWNRPDLPCEALRVCVENAKPGDAVCRLLIRSQEEADPMHGSGLFPGLGVDEPQLEPGALRRPLHRPY